MLFVRLPDAAARRLERADVRFYDMGGGVARFVTSFQTTEADAHEALRADRPRAGPMTVETLRDDAGRALADIEVIPRGPSPRADVVAVAGADAGDRRRRRLVPAAGVPGQRHRRRRRRRPVAGPRRVAGPAPAHDGARPAAGHAPAPPVRRRRSGRWRSPGRRTTAPSSAGRTRPGTPTTSRATPSPRARRAPWPRCCAASTSGRGSPTPPSTPATDGRVARRRPALGDAAEHDVPGRAVGHRDLRRARRRRSGHRRRAAGPGGGRAGRRRAGRRWAWPSPSATRPSGSTSRSGSSRCRTSARSCSRRPDRSCVRSGRASRLRARTVSISRRHAPG